MNFNFMHILADLGFIRVGSKKAKHAIEYAFSKYACTRLSRAKRDTIWTKH
jgi:hypothetical protein